MLYYLYEMQSLLKNSVNNYLQIQNFLLHSVPLTNNFTTLNRFLQGFVQHYSKPEFGLDIEPVEVVKKDFCRLIRFPGSGPKVLFFAPLSGHYATLLRGTVKEFLHDYDVYITDWEDASQVPNNKGIFCLDDYIRYSIEFIQYLGDVHVVAVCQPGVPVLAATSLMAMDNKPLPKSLTLMGSPIDTTVNPTEVNDFAARHSMEWFNNNVIYTVPPTKPGYGRRVYPGFLQLAGFMAMNIDKHLDAYRNYFNHLVEGDEESAQQHEKFYNEYLSVMDLDAQFYLDTIKKVFKEHHLKEGRFEALGTVVDPNAISSVKLLTVEGEKDDITGLGQTKAALDLCTNIADKDYLKVPNAGHYGIFNGKKWRSIVAPAIKKMINAK